jgi:lipopolysaccharide/colanic/teichoic acid biosynthesis glycosyltransferase
MAMTSPRLHGARPTPPKDGHRGRRRGRLPVFSAELFSHLLVRERRRSQRSNRPFVLLYLRSEEPLDATAATALAAATRDTDIVGWVEQPRVIGVVFPELGDVEPAKAVETIRTRVSEELGRRLKAGRFEAISLELRVYPHARGADAGSAGPSPIDPAFHPDLARDRKRRWLSDGIKRGLDLTVSLALLVLLAPLLLVLAALVKFTSRGPVLFRQSRIGQMGRPFRMLKFRTMHVGAGESRHQEFISRYIKAQSQDFKLTNDPRITPVGHLLRRTSLDELPQLWNVLTGEMSLVGPRPPLPYEVEQYAPWHLRRILEAKPGMTGLWQVTGRSRTTFDEMVRLDLRYARTRSLWMDLWILLRTPAAVVSGKGAR